LVSGFCLFKENDSIADAGKAGLLAGVSGGVVVLRDSWRGAHQPGDSRKTSGLNFGPAIFCPTDLS